ncbi:RNA-binding protein [Zavarzinia aquatilis]|uniref:RNA-binding protein n=1 Tax=Zavarzinia aquatilis TaxID=2211142 RepID=A0A317EGF4_9PROT|nr:RNA-binding protein [Zavarzinia aquatilis]PWR24493.1 RNA-binding protein [Zavarzinia aquatilis]
MQAPPLTPSSDVPAPSVANGAADDGPGPIRRCIATGETLEREAMIRYVVGPDGTLVPDLKAILPGRGFWTCARRDAIERAVTRKIFAKAAARAGHEGPLTVPDGLADRIEAMLARRCMDILGLARRAGEVTAGFDKIESQSRKGPPGLLLGASDGAADGKRKLRSISAAAMHSEILTSAELSLALGRENVIHAAFKPGRLAEQFLGEARRLAGFRLLVAANGPELPRAGAQAE